MKVHRLLYYAQAWHLAWEGKPLFYDRIEAWANGPIVVRLYERHKGIFTLQPQDFLEDYQFFEGGSIASDVLDKIWNFYGDKDSQTLSEMTQLEQPWIHARRGLPQGERGQQEITNKTMAYYYRSL